MSLSSPFPVIVSQLLSFSCFYLGSRIHKFCNDLSQELTLKNHSDVLHHTYLSVLISLIIFQWLSQYRAIFWCNLDYMTRHIQVITCIIIKENLRSCFSMKRKKNNSSFWLACVKPRYKDFNINRCWPTCQLKWCIDCCPLQLKKRWNFEIQTVLYSINWLLRGQKLVSLLVEILTDADDAWAENALEEFSLTLLPFFQNAKSWLLSTKKSGYRNDFQLSVKKYFDKMSCNVFFCKK